MIYNDTSSYEVSLLSILIFNNHYLKDDNIHKDLFFDKYNQKIFEILKISYMEKPQLFLESVFTELKKYNLENYFLKIQDSYISQCNYEAILNYLIDYYNKQEVGKLYEESVNKEKSFEVLQQEIKNLGSPIINSQKEYSDEQIMEMITSEKNKLNFETLTNLNKVNISEKQIVVIAARPGVGKSAFASNILLDLIKNYPCLLFNMEMSDEVIFERLISIKSNTPIFKIRSASSDPRMMSDLSDTVFTLNHNSNFKLYSGPKTLSSIQQILLKESHNRKHFIAIIDYLGLINHKANSEYERITHIMKEFVNYTKDYNCTIILLAQETRPNATKTSADLSCLKGSGEIEQSADIVIMLKNLMLDETDPNPYYKCQVLKNRNGKIGNLFFQFHKETQRFTMTDKNTAIENGAVV